MKIFATSILLLNCITFAYAQCEQTFAYGQIKQDCNNSQNRSIQNSIEYTEIPYNANEQVSKHKTESKQVASLEQSVNQAHVTQSNFKPTHTQLDQVKQLLEYAKSQGCTWGGKFDEPLLVCPE